MIFGKPPDHLIKVATLIKDYWRLWERVAPDACKSQFYLSFWLSNLIFTKMPAKCKGSPSCSSLTANGNGQRDNGNGTTGQRERDNGTGSTEPILYKLGL